MLPRQLSMKLTVLAHNLKPQACSQNENTYIELSSIVSRLRIVPMAILELEVLRFEDRFNCANCSSTVFLQTSRQLIGR